MGNTASCAPSIISSGSVKIVDPDGNLQVFTKAVKSAELMVENSGHFVCESSSLRVGQRIQGLSADEDLERRRLYFLLPMDLLYSVLTNEELSFLTQRATKALNKQTGFNNLGKIFPVFSEFCVFPSDSKRIDDEERDSAETVERYAKQRSWKPALDTIVESH